jgi:hypothetical protein
MDERLLRKKVGHPIPGEDLRRRLYIDKSVAPIVMDFATVYRINDAFMDVTHHSHLKRQFDSVLTWMVVAAAVFGVYLWILPATLEEPVPDYAFFSLRLMSFICVATFGYMAFWSSDDELFALSQKPVRFHRLRKKIYAIRRRSFFKRTEGDVVWEIPWANDTIFCINRSIDGWGEHYSIICYETDSNDNVVRAFAMGRRWEFDELEELLAQWNYWCAYMNSGPSRLPAPMLYLAEDEDVTESFFICMYSFGFSVPAFMKLLGMPFIVLAFICRRLTLATCRHPQWPPEIDKPDELLAAEFNEPARGTPVGWKATIEARHRGDWPSNPYIEVIGWSGLNARKNAQYWADK